MVWSNEARAATHAPANAVWNLWSDVGTWTTWDAGLERITLDDKFAAGTTGRLKPKGGPAFKFKLVRVEPNVGFDDETRVPGATIRFHHRVEAAAEGGRTVVVRAEIAGLLAPLWVRILGRDFVKEMPVTLASLVAHAEAQA